jgi:hypothetical protein
VPLYFGRVAGFVIETREMTTDQAEAIVERQARAFELAKPTFVDRWQSAVAGSGTKPQRAKRGQARSRRVPAGRNAPR